MFLEPKNKDIKPVFNYFIGINKLIDIDWLLKLKWFEVF
jgi:hypothetical protein